MGINGSLACPGFTLLYLLHYIKTIQAYDTTYLDCKAVTHWARVAAKESMSGSLRQELQQSNR